MLRPFEYLKPETLSEACELLGEHKKRARPLAGGTDLLFSMRMGKLAPAVIVDIKDIPGLDGIDVADDGSMRIGALTRVRDIERSKHIRRHLPALGEAADILASVQIRNRARIGGNLCNASPSADMPPALIAVDSTAVIAGANRKRTIALEDFFVGPGRTVLEDDELLIELRIPPQAAGSGNAFERMTARQAMDLAVVGVGVRVTVDRKGACKEARIALAAVAPTPVRAVEAERYLQGKSLSPQTLRNAAELAGQACAPIDDVRASADYRRDMVEVYTRRKLQLALERANAALVGQDRGKMA